MAFQGALNGDQIDALITEYLVLLTPSVIGSLSVLAVSIVRWKQLNEQVPLLLQLALADLLAAVILMCTSAMNKVSTEHIVTICQYSLPLSLTFYLISSLLVLVYAWTSMSAIQGWRVRLPEDEGGQNQSKKSMVPIPVYAIVWLTPILAYFLYVLTPFIKDALLIPNSDPSSSEYIQNYTKYCTSCILFLHFSCDSCPGAEEIHDRLIKVLVFLIIIPVMVSCCVIYYKVGKWYKRHRQEGLFPVEGDARSRRRLKSMFSTARNMVMVILFCWAPVLVIILLLNFISWKNIEQRHLFFLYVIQAATVSLQGFLNSMVYAWRRRNFTDAILGENTPLLAYGHLAFFDESLRS